MYTILICVFHVLIKLDLSRAAHILSPPGLSDFHYDMKTEYCDKIISPEVALYLGEYDEPEYALPKHIRALIYLSPDYGAGADGTYEVKSDQLEVFLIKGAANVIKLDAPNLQTFTVIDTHNVKWKNEFWNFPKLRVINLLQCQFNDGLKVATMGSDQLEILRITQSQYTQISFNYDPTFRNLRVFELGQGGFSKFIGLCEFLIELERLEELTLNGVPLSCVSKLLPKLATFRNLTALRLYRNTYDYQSVNWCELFPPGLEHLGLDLPRQLHNISVFDCYKKLKKLDLSIFPYNVTSISSKVPALGLFGNARLPFCNPDGWIDDIKSVVALRINSMFRTCNIAPNLPPSVKIFIFNDNNFKFKPGVTAFRSGTNLKVLDLSNNPIGFIPEGAFDNLPQLSTVVLQRTQLKGFADTVFCRLTWPAILVIHPAPPKPLSLAGFRKKNRKYNHSSLECMFHNVKPTNLIITQFSCDCSLKEQLYINKSLRHSRLGIHDPECTGWEHMDQLLFDFLDQCPEPASAALVDKREEKRAIRVKSAERVEFIATIVFCTIWGVLILLCWLPTLYFYFKHIKEVTSTVRNEQRTVDPKVLFIICPSHAKNWCRKVVVPCLEADLYDGRKPHLKQLRSNSTRMTSVNQSEIIEEQSHNEYRPISERLSASRPSTASRISDTWSGQVSYNRSEDSRTASDKDKPSGPWAWRPRFKCFMAPPGRHRLNTLMECGQVLIIMPSESLFTEPACRAQLRLAFHLHRLQLLPPPGIILWPTTKAKSRIPYDFRSTNRATRRLDEDKYFPAPEFNVANNDPEEKAEVAVIKAKVPSKDDAMNIIRYFSTIGCPLVQWSNIQTARANIEPFVWAFNKSSQIPAY